MSPRFSEHFGLNKTQAELDFVDIPLDKDIPLFVDPYAISIQSGAWFVECNNLIVNFFRLLVSTLQRGDRHLAKMMLSNLHEPNDTHFGLSSDAPRGRGFGEFYSKNLLESFLSSEAVRTGRLSDISDCELMIEGVGSDRISDMTINIIRKKLIEYTQIQCELWTVPLNNVAVGPCWDPNISNWVNSYGQLPVYDGKRILLIPKSMARYNALIDHHRYYQHFVLNFMQAEHMDSNSSLVTVLKNGEKVVYKKDVDEEIKMNNPSKKDYIARFANEHPETLQRYKQVLISEDTSLIDEEIEFKQGEPKDIDFANLADTLHRIDTGNAAAAEFHKFIQGVLTTIFYPGLISPQKEQEIYQGRKRVDILFTNSGATGFFKRLINVHQIHCPYIFVECKNYSSDVSNPEFDQLTGRFNPHAGNFGILVCRRIEDKNVCIQRCKDIIHAMKGYIIVLDDDDIINLIGYRAERRFDKINQYMSEVFKKIIM